MALKIMCAGFGKDEKASLESDLRKSLAFRPAQEVWNVSVVKTGSRLAVSVDGPDERLRAKNFLVEPAEVKAALLDLLTRTGFGPEGAVPKTPASVHATDWPGTSSRPAASGPDESYEWEPPPGPGERRDSHRCPHCAQPFTVTYESGGNEPRQLVSVACPHCWKVDRVEVSESAALSREYRAQKSSGG
jgi:hypothetical protein